MKTRKLGAGGPDVSAIGLGCMSFAGFFGATDEETSHRCLDAAQEAGITFLDTAEIYGMGKSETILGNYFRKGPHKFQIATKGGIQRDPDRRVINTPEYFRKALEGSLQRLGVDYVDLYYMHRRDHLVPIEEAVGVMKEFIDAGKIGGYGLSEVSPTTLRRAHSEHPCMAVQSEYSLWTRSPEIGLVQECERLGVAFVPFSPLARGLFVDQPITLEQMAEGEFRRNVPRFQEPNFSDNVVAIRKLQQFAWDRGWTTAATALAWVLDQGDNMIPIPATRTAEHLAEWRGADEIAFTDADRAALDRIMPIGWAWGDRYSATQWEAPEKYS